MMVIFLFKQKIYYFGGTVLRQVVGIPMGTDCAPVLADLFLHSYESKFLQKTMSKKSSYHLAQTFNKTDRYIDDLMSIDNDKFKDYVSEIYPQELILKQTNESSDKADYLDLFVTVVDGKIKTKLFDKRDAFDFDIVNFPHLESNIPLSPAYGVYVSQLIRYCRACDDYGDFKIRHLNLINKLLKQGYKTNRLKRCFINFQTKYSRDMAKYNIDQQTFLRDVNL